MGQNVNKQSQICGPDIFNKYLFFCNILHAWTTIFGSFSYLPEYVSLLKYGLNIRCKQFWPKRYRASIFNCNNILVLFSKCYNKMLLYILMLYCAAIYVYMFTSCILSSMMMCLVLYMCLYFLAACFTMYYLF